MKIDSRFPLGLQEIKKLIPHRNPFLMLDKVISVTAKNPNNIVGRVCVAQKHITGEEYFFKGHFPNNPIMPGVLILEALAQTGALCTCALEGDPFIKQLFFSGADNVRFKKPIYPGDVLTIKVHMNKNKFSFYWGSGEVLVDDKVLVTADIIANIIFHK